MQYFFELGTNPALCLAEISAVFKENLPTGKNFYLSDDKKILIISAPSRLPAKDLINKLGGVIKIGLIQAVVKIGNLPRQEIEKELFARSLALLLPAAQTKQKKFLFGFSVYGQSLPGRRLGLEIKKIFTEKGIASRFVTSRRNQLSSVVVATNKLVGQGYELVLIKAGAQIFLGQTLTVQPFKDWSMRDYGRPARDDAAGMLPPKLARIMINLAQILPSQILLDPFCGSGTTLTEALLLGYKNLIGTDIDRQAIKNTSANLAWLKDKYHLPAANIKLRQSSVNDLPQKLPLASLDAIVTEPYLGPARGRINIKRQIKELSALYSEALRVFARLLRPAGRIVMVWPVFRPQPKSRMSQCRFVKPDLSKFKIINPLWPDFRPWVDLSPRQTIIYGRPQARIWREIVVLKLIS